MPYKDPAKRRAHHREYLFGAIVGLLFLFVMFNCASANTLLENTAVAALIAAKHSATGTTLEHGGMLVRRQTDWGLVIEYFEPTPEGSQTEVTVLARALLGEGDMLVGPYHLHLCMTDYYHGYFSVRDVITAIFSGVPEFMLDECTGEVHEFDPKVDKVHDTGIDAHIKGPNGERQDKHIPSGRIIADIGETEPEHQGP